MRRPYNAPETCPLIRRDLRSCHLPPKGKAYGRPQGSPLQRKPDHERWFGKPRRRCGTAPAAIFANPGPSGPEGIAEAAPFLRAGNPATSNNRASPVMGSGVRRIWARSAHPEPSPGAFWFLCRHGQRNSPPAGGEIPLRKAPPDTARRVVAPYGRDKISEGGGGKPPPYRSAKRRRKWRNPCRKEQKQNGHRLPVQNRLHQTVR